MFRYFDVEKAKKHIIVSSESAIIPSSENSENQNKSSNNLEQLGSLAIVAPIVGAIIADDAMGGVPSSIAGAAIDVLDGIIP